MTPQGSTFASLAPDQLAHGPKLRTVSAAGPLLDPVSSTTVDSDPETRATEGGFGSGAVQGHARVKWIHGGL